MDQKLPYLKHLGYHDGHSGHDVEFEYAIFDDGGSHIPGRICVFSTSPQYNMGLTLIAEGVIDRIAKKEGLGWHDVWFCDMQTHHAHDWVPPGYYNFQVLTLQDKERHPGKAPHVEEWRSIECPLPVFKRFEELIGSFPTLEEILDPRLPCYKDYTEEQMRQDLEACKGHVQWRDTYIAENLERNKHKLVSIEEAFARNYRLMPWGMHLDLIPDDDFGSSAVVVDLQGSHLLGQCTDRRISDPFKRPDRFSLWKSELDWYPIKRKQLEAA